jgi:beta-lactamase class A
MGSEGDDRSNKRFRRRKSGEGRRGDSRSARESARANRAADRLVDRPNDRADDPSSPPQRPRRPELPSIRRPGDGPIAGAPRSRKPRNWFVNLLTRRRTRPGESPNASPRTKLSLAPRPRSVGEASQTGQRRRADAKQGQRRETRNPGRSLRAVESRRTADRGQTRPIHHSRRPGAAVPLNPRRRQRVASVYRVPQQSAPRRLRRSRPAPYRPSNPLSASILYGLRLIIVGVGIGVIAGTLLAALDPSNKINPGTPAPKTTKAPNSLNLTQEIAPLKAKIAALAKANPNITPGVMILDLDSQNYVSINADRKVSSASLIKLPILIAFFQAVDSGQVNLKESLILKAELIAKEAGEMQFKPIGTKFTALETATEMIRISDNTATNLLIDRLGGAVALNSKFQSWGLVNTQITSFLPDIQGTNTTSPKELISLLQRLTQGDLVSMRSRDRIFEILRSTEKKDLLPQGLGEGATIAHKTGTLSTLIGDVGMVDTPSGKRYLISALAERPAGDERAEELIRQISKETYQFMDGGGKLQGISAPKPVPRSNIAEDARPKSTPKPATMTIERQADP